MQVFLAHRGVSAAHRWRHQGQSSTATPAVLSLRAPARASPGRSSNAIRHRYQSGRAGYGGTALIPEFIGFMPRILLRDYDIVSWDPKRACGLVATAFSQMVSTSAVTTL